MRGHGILCVLNVDSKVTQDYGRTLHEQKRVMFQNQLAECKKG